MAIPHLTRPIVQLRTGVRRFSLRQSRRPDRTAAGRPQDELGSLASDFDAMAQISAITIRSRKSCCAMSRMNCARRWRGCGLQLAWPSVAQCERTPSVRQIDKEVEKLDALIGQILRFSRVESRAPLAAQNRRHAGTCGEIAADAQLEAGAGSIGAPAHAGAHDNSRGPGTLRVRSRNRAKCHRHAPRGSAIELAR